MGVGGVGVGVGSGGVGVGAGGVGVAEPLTVYDTLVVADALSQVRVKVTVTVALLAAFAVKTLTLRSDVVRVQVEPAVSVTLMVSLPQMFSLTVSLMVASLSYADRSSEAETSGAAR